SHPHKPSRTRERPHRHSREPDRRHPARQSPPEPGSQGAARVSESSEPRRMNRGGGFPPPGHMGPKRTRGSLTSKKSKIFNSFGESRLARTDSAHGSDAGRPI